MTSPVPGSRARAAVALGALLALVSALLVGPPAAANELDRAFVTQIDLRPQGGDRQPRPNLDMNVFVRLGNCPAGRATCVEEADAYQVQLLVGADDRIAADQLNEIPVRQVAASYIAEFGNLGALGIREGDSIRARARARNPAGWSEWLYSDREQVLADAGNARLSSNITPPRIAAAGAGARLITPDTNRISVNLGEWRQPDVASAVSSIWGWVMYCTDAECNLSNDQWNIGLREGWGRTLRNDRACCGSAAAPTYTIDVDIQDDWTGFRVRSSAINPAGQTEYVVSDVFPILGRGAAPGPQAGDVTPPEYTPQRGRAAEFLGEPVVGSWLFVFPGTWSSTINEPTRISYSIRWYSCDRDPSTAGGYAAAGCERLLDGLVNQFLLRPISNDLWTRYVYACVTGKYADRDISPGYQYENACSSPVQIRVGVPAIDPAAIPPVPDELLDPGAGGGAVAQPGQAAADPLGAEAERLASQGQAAGADAQAAAAGIDIGQAPVLGIAGVAERNGLTLRMVIPEEQERGLKRKKKKYRAFVSTRAATGKVRFTLTRISPKGNLVIGKTKTVKLKKAKGQRRGVIKWKFAKKKPVGPYTVYVTYLPNKKAQRRGYEGITAAKSMLLN